MLNQCILVGKVTSIKDVGKPAIKSLSISRNYKEPGGEEYIEDVVKFTSLGTLRF